MRAQITGTGSCLPDQIVTNDFLSTIVDTSDEWIRTRTGIRQRHISTEETTVSLAVEAGRRALLDAGVLPGDLDLILVATCSADTLVPSTACQVQSELGAPKAFAFDLNAACSGFIYAMTIVDSFIQTGNCKTALVIGVETLSRLVDWKDRSTCVLFADGAGATVVQASDTGVLVTELGADGTKGEAIYVKSRENCNPFVPEQKPLDYLYMDGAGVYKFAVKTVPRAIESTLAKAGLTADEIDLYLLHQANIRINQAIAKKLKVSMDKVPLNLDRCGNTSAASIPLLLDEVNKKGMLQSKDKVVMAGFGAGLTWGVLILEWA